ncbi:MAG: two-component system response regulator [Anaerolineales bacterium]|nr:two-component system response regulator [Chloroflexota bacterium]MBL7161054.1 two-component system response regulator [Anaerolineales bacterium]
MMNKNNQANIMVVDDIPENLRLLESMLRKQNYRVLSFPRGNLALQAAQKIPPDLILLDINMPEMDGYEVCRQLKLDPHLSQIPVIFLSALNEASDKVRAFNTGGVDYITKPFQFEEVQARVETHLQLRSLQMALEQTNLRLEEKVQEQVKEIADSQMATIFALAKLAESRDDDTGKHIDRVQVFCRLLTDELSQTTKYQTQITPKYYENIYHASPLHDIGKVGIEDGILLKPGKLTLEEFEMMKTHTVIGAQTLEAVSDRYPRNGFINMGIEIARSHHEKWSGSGYPDGLAGEQIPLAARIMAVVDVYDALRTKRVYKPAFPHEKAFEIITEDSGSHFDPEVVAAFEKREGQFHELSLKMSDP